MFDYRQRDYLSIITRRAHNLRQDGIHIQITESVYKGVFPVWVCSITGNSIRNRSFRFKWECYLHPEDVFISVLAEKLKAL